jgi:hypothetical protein
MSESDEIQLRRLRGIWQSRQDLTGVITLFLAFLTLGVCLFFVAVPGHQLAGVMAGLMVLLIFSCWRLISAAAKVVEIGKLLKPSRFNPGFNDDFMETEVSDSLVRRF